MKLKLLLNFVSLGVVQSINFILPLLMTPMIISRSGFNNYGKISFTLAAINIASVFVDFGLNITSSKRISTADNRAELLSDIIRNTIFVKAILFLCTSFFLLALITVSMGQNTPNLFIYGSLLTLFSTVFLPTWYFQGREQSHHLIYISIISKSISVLSIYMLYKNETDLKFFHLIYSLGPAIINASISIFIITKYKIKRLPPFRALYKEYLLGKEIFKSNLYNVIYANSGVMILKIFTNEYEIGLYSAAEKITTALWQSSVVFFQATFPYVCQHIKKINNLKKFFMLFYLPSLSVVILCCSLVFIFSHEVIILLTRESQPKSEFLLQIMCFAPVLSFLNLPFFQFLLAKGNTKGVSKAFFYSTLINLFSNLVFGMAFGVPAVASTVLITQFAVLVFLIYYFKTKHWAEFIIK